jgi:predicted short-subunit dehydrogenase-like oxidoreductase (DUF2520 family)
MNKNTFIKKEISIIGAGRVGTTFAAVITGLNLPDVEVAAVLSRSSGSIKRAKEILGKTARKTLFSTRIEDLPESSNCVMICTPDDRIEDACKKIVDSKEGKVGETLFIHFSGAKPLGVLEAALSRNAFAAAIHPIKSFASIKDSIRTIKGTVFGVTYSPNCGEDARSFISYLIKKLEGRTIMVDDDTKSLYHASACVSSNYLVSLINYAVRINEAIGISPEDSLNGLIGLIEGTVANVKRLGSKKSLTGPVARGDIGTIREHMESFDKNLDKDDVVVYKVMGRETSVIAYENGWIDKKTLNEFIKIFSQD